MQIIRDLTSDFRMSADSQAAIIEVQGEYYVAWGLGHDATIEGEPWRGANTDQHGVVSFPTIEAAEAYVADVVSCYA